jgi:hypothetical protein
VKESINFRKFPGSPARPYGRSSMKMRMYEEEEARMVTVVAGYIRTQNFNFSLMIKRVIWKVNSIIF